MVLRATNASVLVSEYIELCSTIIFTYNCNTYLLLCIGVKRIFYVKGKLYVFENRVMGTCGLISREKNLAAYSAKGIRSDDRV